MQLWIGQTKVGRQVRHNRPAVIEVVTTPFFGRLLMRRADESVSTPREREELERMLQMMIQVKETMRSFEDGEINLRDAVGQMALTLFYGW
jgi:hypothetical protein